MPAAAAQTREEKIAHVEALHQKRVRMARDRLDVFTEMCGRDENGKRVELAPIHRAWVWHVAYCWDRGLQAIILAPFGSGKSSTLAVPLAAWLIGLNPQIRMQVVSNGDPYAKRRVSSVKQIIETPAYQEIFPDVRKGAKWSDHEFFVKREGHAADPTLLARGVVTQGVGSRSDATIFDDVCDELNTADESRRNKIKGLVRNTWMSRLDQEEGRLLWIATPWHVDDATNMMIEDKRSCTLIQRVAQNLEEYTQEVINAGSDYIPGLTT